MKKNQEKQEKAVKPEKMLKKDLIERLKTCEDLLHRTNAAAVNLQTENEALKIHSESSRMMISVIMKTMKQSKVNVSKKFLQNTYKDYDVKIYQKEGSDRVFFELEERKKSTKKTREN